MARWLMPLAIAAGLLFPLDVSSENSKSERKIDQSSTHREPGVVTIGKPRDRNGAVTLALTFDDGPHPTLTPQLLDILRETGTKATFYVLGSLAQRHPEIIARMVKEGHEVGNHTWSHPDLRRLKDSAIRKELQKTEDAILAAGGRASFSTRPPYGAINQRVINAIPEARRPIVMWTVDPLDWKKPGTDIVAQRLLDGARPGAILLCHDIHPGTVDAVKIAVPKLISQGYTFSTVSEILTHTQVLDLDHDP